MLKTILKPRGQLDLASQVSIRLSLHHQDCPSNNALKGEVVSLYKSLIHLSREWPTDLKPQIKRAFIKNKDVTDPKEIRKLIDKGEYICKEITATYYLRKYRAMKRRYYSEDSDKHLQDLFDKFK